MTMNKYQQFTALHNMDVALFLGNVHDVLSALLFEHVGFKAIGTTSWGVANTFGYQDGENIKFADYLTLIKRIIENVTIPVSVDIEAGYSENLHSICENVLAIAHCGAVGINIEDSFKRKQGLRTITSQCDILERIRQSLDANGFKQFFINARTDPYLQKMANPLSEALLRGKAYTDSGASGLFVPGICTESDIYEITSKINIPVNVLSLPNLTDLNKVSALGVKRLSFGNAFSDLMICHGEKMIQQMLEQGNTALLYDDIIVNLKFKENTMSDFNGA